MLTAFSKAVRTTFRGSAIPALTKPSISPVKRFGAIIDVGHRAYFEWSAGYDAVKVGAHSNVRFLGS